MEVGTAWYPEYFRESEWARDLGLIRDAGITIVRFAEFAWSQIEPERDQFELGWMHRALAAFEKFGISAVIGTPTATPPVWLVEENSEILPVDDTGRRTVFGARQHRCYNAPAYQERSRIVVERLAQELGNHPVVSAWQIDNEIGGEAKACYCNYCLAAFHRWLEPRYEGIEDLNRRWGTAFWSETYHRFDQIPVPVRPALQLGLKHNPSLMLEWMRFHSHSMVTYCHDQAAVLRKHVCPGAPILTNYDAFDWGENIDVRRMFEKLDVAGFDLYTRDDDRIAFYCNFMHDVLHKPFWMMEYSVTSPKLSAELDAIATSGLVDKLCFFAFRAFPWGQEQSSRSLISVTGKPASNYAVIRDWTTKPRPVAMPAKRRVGMVYDFDSSWAYFLMGWSGIPGDLIYPRYQVEVVHRALYSHGERARFILRPDDLRNLDLILLAWTIIRDPEMELAVLEHLRGGGSMLMTQDVFLKNVDNVFNESLPPLYTEFLGCTDDFLDHALPGDHALVCDLTHGKSRVVVLGTKAGLDDWYHWIAQLLPAPNRSSA